MDPLWAGLGVVTIGAAIGRIWLLPHGLPNLATSDEVAVVTRTNMVMHGHLPTTYDWPSGSMVLLAGLLRVLGFVDHSFVVGGSHAQFLAARLVSAVAGVALCPVTGLVAYQLTIHRGREVARVAAWSAALVVAVAYTAFRMSGYAHPEIEQALFATLSVLSTVCYVRHRLPALAVAAGALAGLAAATKYIGGFALIPLLVAVLFCGGSLRRRLATGIAAIAAAAVVFVALVPAVFFRWSEFLDGVKGQFSHQADGHLGYDSSNPALGFHVTQSLPGSLGWPLTVVLLIGAVIGLVGSGRRRGWPPCSSFLNLPCSDRHTCCSPITSSCCFRRLSQ